MITLTQALHLAKMALAKRPFIRHFMHFLLKPGSVTACDDRMGIRVQTPAQTLDCCVPGLEFIKAVTDGAKFTLGTGSVVVSTERSKLKLPTMRADDYPLLWPEPPKSVQKLVVGRDFLDGLAVCMLGAGKDEERPEFLGITVIPGDDLHVLASTDNVTVTSVTVHAHGTNAGVMEPFVMPDPFCRALLAAADVTAVSICIDHSKIYAQVGDSIQIFCSHFTVASPWDFQGMIAKLTEEVANVRVGELPDNWSTGLQQTAAVLGADCFKGADIRAASDGILVSAQREAYSVDVSMQFNGSPPRTGLRFDPKLLLRAPKSAVFVRFGDRLAYFTDTLPDDSKLSVIYAVSSSADVS